MLGGHVVALSELESEEAKDIFVDSVDGLEGSGISGSPNLVVDIVEVNFGLILAAEGDEPLVVDHDALGVDLTLGVHGETYELTSGVNYGEFVAALENGVSKLALGVVDFHLAVVPLVVEAGGSNNLGFLVGVGVGPYFILEYNGLVGVIGVGVSLGDGVLIGIEAPTIAAAQFDLADGHVGGGNLDIQTLNLDQFLNGIAQVGIRNSQLYQEVEGGALHYGVGGLQLGIELADLAGVRSDLEAINGNADFLINRSGIEGGPTGGQSGNRKGNDESQRKNESKQFLHLV